MKCFQTKYWYGNPDDVQKGPIQKVDDSGKLKHEKLARATIALFLTKCLQQTSFFSDGGEDEDKRKVFSLNNGTSLKSE